jgi:hypothetical protein
MSSTKPIADVRNAALLVISNRSVIKNRNRIGEIGEFYRIPISI